MRTEEYKLINKEEINGLSFHKEIGTAQPNDLINALENATRLGNGYHSKMRIFFMCDQGPKKVTTTVWATGTKNICLKGGIWIPISHITRIESE
jgi:hypothetical protein